MANRTVRVWWGSRPTGWLNFNWSPITAESVVHISACEWEHSSTIGGKRRIRGQSEIYVKNIRPHGNNVEPNGVEFFVQVGEGGNLGFGPQQVVFDITVCDNPEQDVTV
jgi:hypothetical protein